MTSRAPHRPPLGLSPEEMRLRKLEQAREAKRRRRKLRKDLASSAPLCNYGRTKLCLSAARPSGYCRHHERMLHLEAQP